MKNMKTTCIANILVAPLIIIIIIIIIMIIFEGNLGSTL